MQNPLASQKSKLSDAKRALLEQRLRGGQAGRPALETIPKRPEGPVPLSFAQQRLWFLDQMETVGIAYNIPTALRLRGDLDVPALRRSIQEIVRRHDILRTSFKQAGGQPVQVVAPELPLDIAIEDLSRLPAGEREAAAIRRAREEGTQPFDLAQGPLLRVGLLALGVVDGAPEHVLLITLHHAVSDGWSAGLLFKEFTRIYRAFSQNLPSPLPELAIQYADFAHWQRQWLQGGRLDKQLAYWTQQLHGAPALLELPTDRPRPAVQSQRGGVCAFAVAETVSKRLNDLSQRQGVTLFTTLLAAYAVLLHRYSHQDDICVGSSVANRIRPELEDLVGFFANTLVWRADVSGNPSFIELLRRLKEVSLGAQLHQDMPFEKLVEALQPDRSLSHSPLFQASFVLHNAPKHTVDIPGLSLAAMDIDYGKSNGDLVLHITENTGLDGVFEYSADLFDPATIARMAGHFTRLLEAVAIHPELRLGELPLMGQDERRQWLVDWNATHAPYPRELCLHELFEAQAAARPEAEALAWAGGTVSYGELDALASQWARHLRSLGVGAEARVGLCAGRSPALLVGLLAILKAGGAYVPLDPDYPADRLAFLLADSGARLVLAEPALLDRLPAFDGQTVTLDWQAEPPAQDASLAGAARPQQCAYVIYTSGSTGHPKGVMVSHRNAVHSTCARFGFYPAQPGRFLLLSSFAFDSSVAGIFWTLATGGTLVLAAEGAQKDPAALAGLVQARRVSHLLCLPSLYALLLEQAGAGQLASLAVATVAGEACPPALARRHFERLPGVALCNEYGPTEASVWASAQLVAASDWEGGRAVPIGRPIANTRIYLLDAHGEPVPPGVPGEIHIGGEGVARGYLGRPALTAERFLPDPFGGAGGRLYKTGDLARWRADGALEFLGRADRQVKLRGFRIELGEIEAALAEHPAVAEAVVTARDDGPGGLRLLAYVTAKAGRPSADALRRHLSERLPEHMLPAAFVALDSLPLTPNGKLDRKALPAPEGCDFAASAYAPPQGEAEEALARIWAELLGLERVGRHDDFFKLGGHSLLAVNLIERMREAGLAASVRSLFAAPTLAGLAAAVGEGAGVAVPPNRIPPDCAAITPELLPLVQLSQADIDRIVATVPGGAANVQDIYPLAPLQEGILFHHLLGGAGDAYLMPALLAFDSRPRLDGFLAALQASVARHDILRTSVVWEGLPEPVQVVCRQAPLPLEEIELDPAAGDAALQMARRHDPRHCRMDLRQAPLLRAFIAHDAARGRWLLMLLRHHLVIEHATMDILLEEIQMRVAGEAERLPPPLPYREFVAQAKLGVKPEEHEAFFREMLGDVDEPTAPFGLSGAQGDGSGIEEAWERLDDALARRIRAQAKSLGVGAASLFHLAWALVVARTSGRTDVVFGTVLLGRMQGGAGRALGLFINTLPLRIREDGNVRDGALRTHRLLAELLRHEHAPLALAQRCSQVPAPAPLFTSLFNYVHGGGAANAAGLEGVDVLSAEERTSYPLMLAVDDLGAGFALTAQAPASVGPARVCAMLRTAVENLVTALEAAPDTELRDIDVLPAAERRQVLYDWNARTDCQQDLCIHEGFEAQAAQTPAAIALSWDGGEMAYAELNAQANRLARHLRTLGVGPDQRVAVCAGRGPAMVVALLAVLKAGGAYVPLDPAYPRERLAHMLEDSAPVALVLDGCLRQRFAEQPDGLPRVVLGEDPAPWAGESAANLGRGETGLSPASLAYVIYTSGSTGTPKGVMVEHANVTRLLAATQAWFRFGADDVWTLFHSYAFDFSVWEMWGALLYGGRLAIVPQAVARSPEEFYRLLCKEGVTVLNQTPSAFRQLIAAQAASTEAHRLRDVVFGGEKLETATLKPWYDQNPGAGTRLTNMYGITETTVHVTYRPLQPADAERGGSPIGVRIPDLRVYLLDACGRPVPVGVAGEIHVGGAGVARGYLNRPELTAERFLEDPFAGEPGARMYKSGDLGRWLADGGIEFLGRNDSQVKIRGFRIELGEIEAALAAHPAVREAAVVVRGDGGDPRLLAYYTGTEARAEDLRARLAETLPEYMLPAAFVFLDALPLTPNGKLDRKALPAPEGGAFAAPAYEPPQGGVEEELARIVAESLNLERVGRNDHFFDLGGHSLLATRVMARMREAFGVELPVAAIFETPTIAGLALAVTQQQVLRLGGEHMEALLRTLEQMEGGAEQALLNDEPV